MPVSLPLYPFLAVDNPPQEAFLSSSLEEGFQAQVAITPLHGCYFSRLGERALGRGLIETAEADHRAMDYLRGRLSERLRKEGYIVRRLAISKGETTYDGFLTGHPDVINKGRFCLFALSAHQTFETCGLYHLARLCHRAGMGILCVNHSGAGRSSGKASITAGPIEAGLQVLEKEVHGKEIVLFRQLMTGLSMEKALLTHPFPSPSPSSPRYLLVSFLTLASMERFLPQKMPGGISKTLWGLGSGIFKEVNTLLAQKEIGEIVVESTLEHTQKPSFGADSDAYPVNHQTYWKREETLGHYLTEQGLADGKTLTGYWGLKVEDFTGLAIDDHHTYLGLGRALGWRENEEEISFPDPKDFPILNQAMERIEELFSSWIEESTSREVDIHSTLENTLDQLAHHYFIGDTPPNIENPTYKKWRALAVNGLLYRLMERVIRLGIAGSFWPDSQEGGLTLYKACLDKMHLMGFSSSTPPPLFVEGGWEDVLYGRILLYQFWEELSGHIQEGFAS